MGIASALAGNLLTTNAAPGLATVLARTPQIVLWNWLNLLLFDVNNQCQAKSVLEDSVNKPWRAIPSQRLTAQQARRLLLIIIPTVFLATRYLGGTREAVALMVMTWMYNDLGGADDNFIIRNSLNALGYMCYSSGSMIVATGYGQHHLNKTADVWLTMIGAIIFTTLQMQDMPDVKGDAARRRRTIPLVYGDLLMHCVGLNLAHFEQRILVLTLLVYRYNFAMVSSDYVPSVVERLNANLNQFWIKISSRFVKT